MVETGFMLATETQNLILKVPGKGGDLENAYTSIYEEYFQGSLLDIVLLCFARTVYADHHWIRNLIREVPGKGEAGKCIRY